MKPPGPRSQAPDPLAAQALTRYVHAHLDWMLTHGYSADTVRARRVALRRFVGWCAERTLDDPRAITKPILERYQRSLFYHRKADGKPLTLGTQHGCLAPVKTFFKWLSRENHILYNPASELVLPKPSKRLPRTLLSVADVEAILNEAEPVGLQGVRDRAMLETLYSTGLRRMELPALAIYDVDLTRRLVFVREGKGRKDRVVPLGERAAAWLEKYLVEARPQLLAAPCEALFVSDYGEPVTPVWLADKVKRYMEFAGIHKPGATHLLRHACATHMLENGADIRYIQELLGHANLATTEIYTHVSIEKLQQIHAATHPAKLTRAIQTRALLSALAAEAQEDADD
ncbi:MAG: recombinase XerD [Xanthomonadaceae bacterium]|nr:recombinase XerD [Xanthomonadaceae bacterium]